MAIIVHKVKWMFLRLNALILFESVAVAVDPQLWHISHGFYILKTQLCNSRYLKGITAFELF